MPQVVLQPAGGPDARAHYRDTITEPVPLGRIEQFIPSADSARLRTLFPERTAATWGVVPGKNGVNVGKWEKVAPGDILFFAGEGHIRATGVIVHKLHVPDLAQNLWGRDEQGQTWEYIYFIDQVEPCLISYERFAKAAGYAPNYVVLGFNVLDEDRSANVLADLELNPAGVVGGTQEDFEKASELPDGMLLDAKGQTLLRKEQGFLRRQLFGRRPSATCFICGRDLPVDLLVAAHIKKRALCSLSEKRDYSANVVAMCRLGCDDLFEKGYIIVDGGVVRANGTRAHAVTTALQVHLASLLGETCFNWSQRNAEYFLFHRSLHSS